MSVRLARGIAIATGLLIAVVVTVCTYNSLRWVGATFPGFFVLENRVVPSIALPEWPDPSDLYQQEVLAVDDVPVENSAAVYDYVRSHPADTPIRYTMRGPEGVTKIMTMRSRLFTRADYVFLFGSYLLSGSAFILTGLLVFALKPHKAAAIALASAGAAIGTFAITAVDLYWPHWFFRLHVLGEVFLAPGCIHLALVFPTNRLPRHRRTSLVVLYVPFAVFAIVYELVLFQPSAYSLVHLVASGAQGVAGALLLGAIVSGMFISPSPLVRRRMAVVGLGAAAGFLVPTVLMTTSGMFGGTVAVNGAALTAFFFPFALGYAIVKQDLFEIDVLLRRAITYGIVVVAIGGIYFLALYCLGVMVPGQMLKWSPIALASLNFVMLFLISSVRERVQRAVDRVFFRQAYNVEHALSRLSHVLASARAVEQVVAKVLGVFGETIGPSKAAIFLLGENGRFSEASGTEFGRASFVLEEPLAARFDRGETLARYEWEDGSEEPPPAIWSNLDAELLVPIRMNGVVLGMIVLGVKSSGRSYSVNDRAFLGTAANQFALALTNAKAFDQLEELNTSLEGKVQDRTAELYVSNAELNRSVTKLKHAYEKLEQSQDTLLRADRLATLGRLTAGIAHEMNTPLSAVLNALKILVDLGREYAAAVDDPEVLPEDHREIAGEIVTTAREAASWAQKAAWYISSVKGHGREPRSTTVQRIDVNQAIAETRALLSHRLRTASCGIDLDEKPEGLAVFGDPARLSQVLLNLCGNAIEAYEDVGAEEGRVLVEVRNGGGKVTLKVHDWAGGIPGDVLPRIFDELFTTKGPGRGTGLGLWIARNLVQQAFGGTLTVETTLGVGSCFTATFPEVVADDLQDSTDPSVFRMNQPAKDLMSLH